MTQDRVYNFSAGPAVLPEEVLKTAQDEMMNYQDSGMSVMEMSHRSKTYDNIIKTAEKDLRDLLNIPENYKVLFLQGGAHLQFSMVPINLLKNGVADYSNALYFFKKCTVNGIEEGRSHYYIGSCFYWGLGVPVDYEKDGVRYINPGSVSIPKENSWHGYIVLEDGIFTWKNLDGEIQTL